MEPSKPWYQSTTIQGAIVKAIAFGLVYFGINIPGLEQQLSAVIEALMMIVGFVMVIVGRIKADGPVTVGKTTLLLSLPLVAAGMLALTGCASISGTTVASASAQLATSEALFRMVKPEKRAATARQIYEIADLSLALANGQPPDLGIYREKLLALAKGDPAALLVVDLLVAYYAEHYAEISAQNPGTIAGIRAIATGVKAGASYYLTAPAPPAS